MIEANDLIKGYNNGENVLYAINKVSLKIDDGDFVVILGPSGSGKSTLINTLSGLEKADSGILKYDNVIISNMNDNELTEFRRKKVGFVFQNYYLLPSLNIEANIKMGANLSGNKELTKVIEAVGLNGKENKFPFQLSGGEQQRVSIARALAKNPKVLFCDEPTGALDEETGRQVLNYIINLQIKNKFTLIMVTHNKNFASLADKVIKMNSGKIGELIINDKKLSVDEIEW